MIIIKGLGYSNSIITLGLFRTKKVKVIHLLSKKQLKVELNAKFNKTIN
jgi:hypothetical protein